MVKVLSFRFEQCFGPFNTLLVQGFIETGLFKHGLATFLGLSQFKNTLAIRVIFFSNNIKIEFKFRKCKKNYRKTFSFLR